MLIEEALKLRRNWAMKGNPPCNHEKFSEEFYWNKRTGNYICTNCGKLITSYEREQEIENSQNKSEVITSSQTPTPGGTLHSDFKGSPKQCDKFHSLFSRRISDKFQWLDVKIRTTVKNRRPFTSLQSFSRFSRQEAP